MSKSNAIAIGGLVAIGVVGVLIYKAYQKGRANGHAEGYRQATQRYESEIQTLKDANYTRDNIIKQKDAEIRQQLDQIVARDAEIVRLKQELKRISEK